VLLIKFYLFLDNFNITENLITSIIPTPIVFYNLPSEYLGGRSLEYLEFGIPHVVYLRLLHDPSIVLYLLLGQGPTGGWHPAPCGAVGISPKLEIHREFESVQNINI